MQRKRIKRIISITIIILRTLFLLQGKVGLSQVIYVTRFTCDNLPLFK